jgi:hypothetical protein
MAAKKPKETTKRLKKVKNLKKVLVMRYRAIAVPLEPGKSGVRAFCTDQTGALWYDPSGSPENCLATRRTID